MTETVAPNTETSLTLGQQLKQAREAQGLSIIDVNAKTNLKKNHIESFENDIFILQNIPPAFVRGYVRNYVRFLRLPETLITTVNYGEVTIPKTKEPQKVTVDPIKPNQHKSQGKWIKFGSALVVLGVVGMTLTWWWQNYQKDQENREELVSSIAQPEPVNNQNFSVASNAQPVAETAPVVISEPAPVVVSSTTETQPATTAPVVNNIDNPTSLNLTTTEPATPAPAVVTENETVNVLQQPASLAIEENVTTEQPAAAVGNDELRIEITGSQSWITVRGANNKRLAEKLYATGEVLTFNGNEQYRLTVGAPANVKIYYKGQEVPMKLDGRVARFRLPQ